MRNRNNTSNVIGVDIGGVIIGRINDKADTSFFGAHYLDTPEIENAISSLELLSDAGFEIFLVSKCGKNVQEKSINWLEQHNFFARSGVATENLRFCRTRPEKAQICSDINASYFVDDRLEVLSYLRDVQHLFLFNADDKEVAKFAPYLGRVHRTNSWTEIAQLIISRAKESLCS